MSANPIEPVTLVAEAISRRDRPAVEALSAPDIEVRVHALPTVAAHVNEHLWRDVSLSGRDDLHAYLNGLFESLPSLTMLVESLGTRDRCVRLAAAVTGVDGDGSPFEAYACIHAHAGDGMVRTFDCEISHVGVGPELLRSDPRRYLRYFIDAPDASTEMGAA